jgi:hypothetical protein
MQPVPINDYFFFGTAVRYLQDAAKGATIHGDGFILWNLDQFFERLEELNLQVTKRVAYDLFRLRQELAELPADATLTVELASKLGYEVGSMRKTLEAELAGMEAFVISPKRIDVEKLLKDPGSLLAPDAFAALTENERLDISEAARCIAFERPTAAAFHLMRATEGVLRDFYSHFVKKNRCSPLLWYPMVAGLQKHRKAKKHEVILRNLDNIRLSFRNPTQHPDKTYDIHEAQDLWGLCVDAINRMTKIRAA